MDTRWNTYGSAVMVRARTQAPAWRRVARNRAQGEEEGKAMLMASAAGLLRWVSRVDF
ncbi:hypothetical protein [Duffyella gerundensis]|uniref:hypothetical protein n=1 Tax=Duffyella gerundensis TaxID=1619313 RepID=UPI0016548A5F|nr:hypothetical protein [Duffyella gerundensis]